MTFPNDEERRKHFLGLLRAGLQELREKLSVPFTNLEDTYTRLKSLEHWPLGTDEQIRNLARRIALAASSTRVTRDPRPATSSAYTRTRSASPSARTTFWLCPIRTTIACPNPFIEDFIKHQVAV